MPEIQDPELSSKLRERFQVKGHGTISTLAPEIVPVVVVDDFSAQDLGTWSPAVAGDIRVAAGGTEMHHWSLTNPANSGMLLEVLSIQISAGFSGPPWNVYFDIRTLTTLLTSHWRDRRLGGNPVGDLRWENPTGVIAGMIYRIDNLDIDNAPYEVLNHGPIILPPGRNVAVSEQDANLTGSVVFTWRERQLRPED